MTEIKPLIHAALLVAPIGVLSAAEPPEAPAGAKPVPLERMRRVYEEVKTPFKQGIVVRGEEGQSVDCPSIFRRDDQSYRVYVGISPKGKTDVGYEKIGMAVSEDMVHWQRHGTEPVVANGEDQQRGISGDPQLVRMDELWVMFYFGAFWKPKAFDTFSCSTDLLHWTKWDGPHLVEPSEPWDSQYAHKPWVIKHGGVVYHFYCALGDQGRVIALATSKDLSRQTPAPGADEPGQKHTR